MFGLRREIKVDACKETEKEASGTTWRVAVSEAYREGFWIWYIQKSENTYHFTLLWTRTLNNTDPNTSFLSADIYWIQMRIRNWNWS